MSKENRGGVNLGTRAKRLAGYSARRAKTAGRAVDLSPVIAELRAGGATTLQQLADGLTQRGIPTADRKTKWSPSQVWRLLRRVPRTEA